MPSPYSRSAPSAQGFTLVEIMAVLIVIGIAAGMVTLSIGDATRPQKTKTIARQLYGGMGLALENAVFLNQQIGLRFDFSSTANELSYSYEWLYFDVENRQWQELVTEGFERQELPEFIELELQVDEQKVIIGAEKKDNDLLMPNQAKTQDKDKDDEDEKKKPAPNPDLYFLSSGEMQNFTITITDKDKPESHYVITGDALGQMTFKRPDEDEQ